MNKQPLFRDPGEDDQREDGYSAPHGFLIGGLKPFERVEQNGPGDRLFAGLPRTW